MKLISIRLDKRTVIQVRPGVDILKVKERFLQRLADSKVEATHYKVLKSLKKECQ